MSGWQVLAVIFAVAAWGWLGFELALRWRKRRKVEEAESPAPQARAFRVVYPDDEVLDQDEQGWWREER